MKVVYAIPEEVYSERLVGWHDEGLLDSDICCDMQIFQFLNLLAVKLEFYQISC